MKKIIFILLLLITSTVLGDSVAHVDGCVYKGPMLKCIEDNLSFQVSVGVTDVYGSIHDLSPIQQDRSLGHGAIGAGLFNVPISVFDSFIEPSGNWRLYFDANINYGTVVELDPKISGSTEPSVDIDFERGTDISYSIGYTLKIFPFSNKEKFR